MPKSTSNWHNRPRDQRYSTKRWRALRLSILARSTTCGICGHGNPPAASVDHIQSAETHPELFYDPANLQPAHNIRQPCTTCSVASRGKIRGDCQSMRGSNDLIVTMARLKKRTGLEFGQYPGQPAPLATTASSGKWPYATVNEALADLENTPGKADLAPGDLAEVWDHAGEMACRCGPADFSACFTCLPVPWA